MALGIGSGLHTSSVLGGEIMKLYFPVTQENSCSFYVSLPTSSYNTSGDHLKWTMDIYLAGDWDGTDEVYTRFNYGNNTQMSVEQLSVETWHTISKTAEFGNGGNNTPKISSHIDWPASDDQPAAGSVLYIKNMRFLVTSDSEYDSNGHTGDLLNRKLNFSDTNVTNTTDGVAVSAIDYAWGNIKHIQLGCGTTFYISNFDGSPSPALTLGSDGP